MGHLDKSRAAGADGKDYVIAHTDLERALSEIFGIRLGLNITRGIFGDTPRSDGTIFHMRFKAGARSSDPSRMPGIIFSDGVTTKKLTIADSKISLWTLSGTSWLPQDYDFEAENNPKLTEFEDVNISELNGTRKNLVVGTSSFNGRVVFSLTNNEVAEGGAHSWFDLNEVKAALSQWVHPAAPDYFKSPAGTLVQVQDATTLTPLEVVKTEDTRIVGSYNASNPVPAGAWTLPAPWVLQQQADTTPSGAEYFTPPEQTSANGVSKAGWDLERGVWAISLSFGVATTTFKGGVFKWDVVGGTTLKRLGPVTGVSSRYITTPIPYKFETSAYSDFNLLPVIRTSTLHPYVDAGTYLIAVPSTTRVAINVWHNSSVGSLNIYLKSTIKRIS